jgi:hypothetical protein
MPERYPLDHDGLIKKNWIFIFFNYLNLVAETEIVTPAPTNAQGVLGGVQERPGVPRGVQKLSSCQCSGKISRRDKNRTPSTYKRPGGPERGPGMPGGSLGGSRNRRVANAVVKKVAKMKMVTPAATNALGVLGGVQERPGGPSGGSRNPEEFRPGIEPGPAV